MNQPFHFFSFNKQSDWETGLAFNLMISDTGLLLRDYGALPYGNDETTGSSEQTRGIYYSAALDCRVDDLRWHKIVMDVQIPEDSDVSISYYASNTPEVNLWGIRGGVASGEADLVNLDDYLRDNTIAPAAKIDCLEKLWVRFLDQTGNAPVVNPQDALLHHATGRYLWFKIEVSGNIQNELLIRKLRLYFPRFSLLQHLPAVYQEDPESQDFLERFLAIPGAFYEELDEKIDQVALNFDADLATGEFLRWLSGWLVVAADDRWSEAQLRQLIKRAPEIYKMRGTKKAIEAMVEIYTGEKPLIIEYFQYKHLEYAPEFKDLIKELYDTDPYTFTVILKPKTVPLLQQKLAVRKILEEEKPAFTEARLVTLQPWIYLDTHTYLGINTNLSEFTTMRLDPESAVLYNNVLADGEQPDGEDNSLSIGADLGWKNNGGQCNG